MDAEKKQRRKPLCWICKMQPGGLHTKICPPCSSWRRRISYFSDGEFTAYAERFGRITERFEKRIAIATNGGLVKLQNHIAKAAAAGKRT